MHMCKYYVIGDIQGRLDLLTTALLDWNRKEEQLVFLGDYIDYGPNSREVIREIKTLKKKYGAITLAGNHEMAFYQYMTQPAEKVNGYNRWYSNGRLETISSFLGREVKKTDNIKEIAEEIKYRYPEVLLFIEELELYHETANYIFSHSGINLYSDNWRKNKAETFFNNSEFIRGVNKTNKIIVFGHFRTGILRGMNEGMNKSALQSMPFLNDKHWVSPDGTKLGINGGPSFNGLLHTVHLEDSGNEAIVVSVNQKRKREKIEIPINKEFNRFFL